MRPGRRARVRSAIALFLAVGACATRPGRTPAGPGTDVVAAEAPASFAVPPPERTPAELRPEASNPPAPNPAMQDTAQPSHPSQPPVEMIPPGPTAFVSNLRALGLEPGSLPLMEQLDPRALRGVMKLIAQSLGVKCRACHVEGDFAAPSRAKNIATRMWNEFAAKLTLPDHAPLFCDSCHHGRTTILDRTDSHALGEWMKAHFVESLARSDGQPMACETCHVGMEMHILTRWASP